MKKFFAVILVCITAGNLVYAQQALSLKEAIASASTEIEREIGSGQTVAVLNFISTSQDFSNYVVDELIDTFTNNKVLKVTERHRMDAILRERNYQLSGEVSDDEIRSIGHQLGAQYVITGQLNYDGSFYRFRVYAIDIEKGIRAASTAVNINNNDKQLNYFFGDKQSASEDAWQNKWLYFRISTDYPIAFYMLQPDGSIDGVGIYTGSPEDPTYVSSLDNKVVALPEITVGIEFQFLNWCSIEPIFQVNWEYLNNTNFASMAAGLELKFPLKFIRNVILEPYAAVLFPIPTAASADIFAEPSPAAFGGGFQLNIKGGSIGAFFIDINYMSFGDVGIYNNYRFYETPTKPDVIHYNRSALGLGAGYKFGAVNRK